MALTPVIQNQRTHLRTIRTEDAAAIIAYKSEPSINQWLGWIPESEEDIFAFLAKHPLEFNQANTWYQLVIVQNQDQKVIGDIGVHFTDATNQQVELGFTLSNLHTGQGFAYEALQGLIQHLFTALNKHRIFASVDPANVKSMTLLERLGFRKEAHHIKSLWFKNQWVDDVIYAMLQGDWKKL